MPFRRFIFLIIMRSYNEQKLLMKGCVLTRREPIDRNNSLSGSEAKNSGVCTTRHKKANGGRYVSGGQ